MVYLITYDLHGPNRDYDNLHGAIRSYGNYWHYLESNWFITTNSSAAQIRTHLQQFIDGNDEILIVKISNDWAAVNLDEDGVAWLHQNVG